nr:retrotransposable element Tf2 [Tanacetum cinerariifolium]
MLPSWAMRKLSPPGVGLPQDLTYITTKCGPPCDILKRIGSGNVAYRLDLPDDAQIHPVFHVSLLKEAGGPPSKIVSIPKEARFSLQSSAVLDQKLVKRRNRAAIKVLKIGFLIPLSILLCNPIITPLLTALFTIKPRSMLPSWAMRKLSPPGVGLPQDLTYITTKCGPPCDILKRIGSGEAAAAVTIVDLWR